MSDEFESINSRIPDLSAALAQRIMAKKAEASGGSPTSNCTVDPYQLMLQRKKQETGEIDPATIAPQWPEAEVKQLQDYCAKMGIVGFSSGRMPPIVALAMLRKQLGDDYTGVSMENRVAPGYEKLGSKYNSNYPYTEAMSKKQILHG